MGLWEHRRVHRRLELVALELNPFTRRLSRVPRSLAKPKNLPAKFGGASRDRTDDLIVANDEFRHSHLTDSIRHDSVFEHSIHPIIGTIMGQTCPNWLWPRELRQFFNCLTLGRWHDLRVNIHRGRYASVSELGLY